MTRRTPIHRHLPCTCQTFDDLCEGCATHGKRRQGHAFVRPGQRQARTRDVELADALAAERQAPTPAQRLAARRGITETEAQRFLARQAASRAAHQARQGQQWRTPRLWVASGVP